MKLSQQILEHELVIFERVREAVKVSSSPGPDNGCIVNRKGKQLRPMFVLLSAKFLVMLTLTIEQLRS